MRGNPSWGEPNYIVCKGLTFICVKFTTQPSIYFLRLDMTFTEILDTFKTKFNPAKIINSLERTADLYDESSNNSEGNIQGRT
jgi:hypothetical protein